MAPELESLPIVMGDEDLVIDEAALSREEAMEQAELQAAEMMLLPVLELVAEDDVDDEAWELPLVYPSAQSQRAKMHTLAQTLRAHAASMARVRIQEKAFASWDDPPTTIRESQRPPTAA